MRVSRLGQLSIALVLVGCAAVAPTQVSDIELRTFNGHYREGCKTVMLTGTPEIFSGIEALRRRLPSDDRMREMHPGIEEIRTAPDGRLPEEEHVVTVTAHLYAVKFEDQEAHPRDDNDFHLIVGDSSADPDTLMNVEVSGLPRAGDPGGKFQAARHELLELMSSLHLRVKDRFDKPRTPVMVEITGSTYFDADHDDGDVGPKGLKPSTVWEIHPVSDLRVMDEGD